MAKIIFMCWKCKSNADISEPVARSAECPVCHADLHSCRNCVFYSPGSHFDCHETVDEPVTDKERSNFCDSFKLRREWGGLGAAGAGTGTGPIDDKAAAAKKAFDSLFSI